jgi:hypothetical protein
MIIHQRQVPDIDGYKPQKTRETPTSTCRPDADIEIALITDQ